MPQVRYAVIHHTNTDWLRYLRDNTINDWANFWTGRQNILRLEEGMPFFFKLDTQVIAGYGTYKEQRRESIVQAWQAYGVHNGVANKTEFLSRAGSALRIRSANDNSLITSIVLTDLIFFSSPPTLTSVGVKAFQTVRYIDEDTAVRILETNLKTNASTSQVEPTAPGAPISRTMVNSRPYQAFLRYLLMKTYNGRCAICGMDEPTLLYASHIIPHRDAVRLDLARNLDNAILLCSLHNDLLDKGFITIELTQSGAYRILISNRLSSSSNPASQRIVSELRAAHFSPPSQYPPSQFSLRFHKSKIFER
jgi:predicted restriction endonuclease